MYVCIRVVHVCMCVYVYGMYVHVAVLFQDQLSLGFHYLQ